MASDELVEGRVQELARDLVSQLGVMLEATKAAYHEVESVEWWDTEKVEWLQNSLYDVRGAVETAGGLLAGLRELALLLEYDAD